MTLSKKIIAFDLDGTLTGSKLPLSPEMARALTILAQQKKVVIISGGSIDQYKKQFLPYFLKFADAKSNEFDNLILMPTSGTEQYLYDHTQKTWMLGDREVFPEKVKKKVFDTLNAMISSGNYDIPNHSYGERIEDRGDQITLSALGQKAPLKKKKLWDPDQRKRQIIKKKFESEISDVSVSIGGTTSLDILPKGFTKAVALKRLLEKFGYKPEDLLYIGDALFPGGNDYSVIEANLDVLKVRGPAETLLNIKKWIGK